MSGPCADCGGPDYQTLMTRVAELEAENGSMADDICSLTTAHDRAEQAEAALAKATKALRYGEEKDLPMLYSESQAALAERDRMLRIHLRDDFEDDTQRKAEATYYHIDIESVIDDKIADLRARAEEGSET